MPEQTKVAVAARFPGTLTVAGMTEHASPLGLTVVLRLTLPLKPPILVTVIVLEPLEPVLKLNDVGFAAMEKSPPA